MHTNDPEKSVVNLRISGKVEKIADISSESLRIEGFVNEDLEKIVTIIPSDKYKFEILSLRISSGENVDVELKKKTLEREDKEKTIWHRIKSLFGGWMLSSLEQEDKGKTIWEVYIKNIRKTPGRYYEAIYLTTDFKLQPQLTIRVFGNIQQLDKLQQTNSEPENNEPESE